MKDTDRELLEWAAKAAGMEIVLWRENGVPCVSMPNDTASWVWNMRDDDGDSRLLQVALRLTLCMHSDGAAMCVSGDGKHGVEVRDQADPAANARMAVLLVAAEIGKGMA